MLLNMQRNTWMGTIRAIKAISIRSYYQLSLFESERKKSEQERMVDELFDKFTTWVTDTMSIQNNPYIRIMAVIKGVTR